MHVLANVSRRVAIGDDLIVREHEEHLNAGLLQADTLCDGAEAVAPVKRPGRTLTREDPKPLRVLGHEGRDLCRCCDVAMLR